MSRALTLMEKIQFSTGKAVTPGGNVVGCVLETQELRRIRDLPRRDWSKIDAEEQVEVLTEWLKTPHGQMRLRPVQAIALCEMYRLGGLFAPIRVGGGKTLISALAAKIFDAKRPVLLVPGTLVDKTQRDFYELSKHWQMPDYISVHSYSKLALDYECEILGGLQPDLIIADEAHKLKNSGAGCTKQVSTYLKAARKAGLDVKFVAMSGSVTTGSINDYWHLCRWALGNNAPLPGDLDEKKAWALALDEKVGPESRWQPGALVRLTPDPKGNDDLEKARNAYGQRFVSAPGVITSGDDRPANGLVITGHEMKAPPAVEEAILSMRVSYETPDGHPFELPMDLWRHCRELQCGFYYRWNPRPPPEYLTARTEWNKFKNDKLKHSRTYHTPGHLVQGIMKGAVDDGGLYAEWKRVSESYEYMLEPVWIDDAMLKYAAKWLKGRKRGLVWAEHQCFGQRLSEMTGVPYFREKGMCGSKFIEDHEGPAIVSIKACGEGLNLQHKWSENLYVSPMSTCDSWEQTLGRTHRDGQPEDEVTAEAVMMCTESYSSMVYAIRRAEFTQQTTLTPQKLVYANRDFGQVENLIGRRGDKMWIQEIVAV
jgi:hypothetical protein